MEYERPILVELGSRAQRARGQNPEGCVSGAAAGTWETCGFGTSAGWSCADGGSPGTNEGCAPGASTSSAGDCLSGSAVAFYCEAGAGGVDDPYGCVAGPSYS